MHRIEYGVCSCFLCFRNATHYQKVVALSPSLSCARLKGSIVRSCLDTLLEVIGQGTFGEVWSAVERHTRESVAVKILEKSRIREVADVERVAREVHILKLIRHPHIIQLEITVQVQA